MNEYTSEALIFLIPTCKRRSLGHSNVVANASATEPGHVGAGAWHHSGTF